MKKHKCITAILLILLLIGISISFIIIKQNIKHDYVNIVIENDLLSLQTNMPKENHAYVWEVDAGSINLSNENTSVVQPTNKYYLYSNADDKIEWKCNDSDGYSYTTATIRLYCYTHTDSSKFHMNNVVASDEITITFVDNHILKTDNRKFGNPIRENSDENWQQIITVDLQTTSYVTLRFRTGKNYDSEIIWKSNAFPIIKAYFYVAPIYVPVQQQYIPAPDYCDTVCYCFNNYDLYGHEAKNNLSKEDIENIAIEAYVSDDPSIKTEIKFKYDSQKNEISQVN